MFVRNPMPEPLDPAIPAALQAVCTSTLGHLRDYGFPKGLEPLNRPISFVGCAVTVRIPHMDSTAVHVAVDDLRPGDVFVVEHSGDTSRSCFGGVVAFTAKTRGAVGAVFGGPVNDRDEIIEYGLPVYSKGVTSHTTRMLGIEGAINVPVSVGGVVIEPGDVIWADGDGLAVLGRDEALEIAAVLKDKQDAEPELREAIKAGKRLSEASGAIDLFTAGLAVSGS
ncbi:MAG: RraA family protein [Actinomycetota bacterium]|nr:RraA family protein [Actinomycetota bacterium]